MRRVLRRPPAARLRRAPSCCAPKFGLRRQILKRPRLRRRRLNRRRQTELVCWLAKTRRRLYRCSSLPLSSSRAPVRGSTERQCAVRLDRPSALLSCDILTHDLSCKATFNALTVQRLAAAQALTRVEGYCL